MDTFCITFFLLYGILENIDPKSGVINEFNYIKN